MGKKGYDHMVEVMKWFAGNTLKHEAPQITIERVIGIKIGTDKRTIKKYFRDLVVYGFITRKGKTDNYQLNHEKWLKSTMEEMNKVIQNGDVDKALKELRIQDI